MITIACISKTTYFRPVEAYSTSAKLCKWCKQYIAIQYESPIFTRVLASPRNVMPSVRTNRRGLPGLFYEDMATLYWAYSFYFELAPAHGSDCQAFASAPALRDSFGVEKAVALQRVFIYLFGHDSLSARGGIRRHLSLNEQSEAMIFSWFFGPILRDARKYISLSIVPRIDFSPPPAKLANNEIDKYMRRHDDYQDFKYASLIDVCGTALINFCISF